MARKWLPLNALRAFEAVGKHLSFTAGAASLSISQSAISRHVISLEQFLGTSLFHRRAQHLELSEAGACLLPVVTRSLDLMQQAVDMVMDKDPRPRRSLRIHMPPTFAHQLAVPLLRDFRKESPDIILDIDSASGPEALGDADASLAYSYPMVGDNVADLLWMVHLTILCHPDLVSQGVPDLREFIEKNEILHVKLDHQPRSYLWTMLAQQMGLNDIDLNRGVVFDTASLAAQYALSGEGIALVDPLLFQSEIETGKLVAPYSVHLKDGYGYYLNIRPDDLADPAIARLRSWLIRRFAQATEKLNRADRLPESEKNNEAENNIIRGSFTSSTHEERERNHGKITKQ